MNSLSENVNGLLFLAGFVLALWGLSVWSVPLAAVVAGVLVMVMAAAPYVRQRWTAAPSRRQDRSATQNDHGGERRILALRGR